MSECYRRIQKTDTPSDLKPIMGPDIYMDYPCKDSTVESCDSVSSLENPLSACYIEGRRILPGPILYKTNNDVLVGTTNSSVDKATCYRNIRPIANPPPLEGLLGKLSYRSYACQNSDVTSCSEVSEFEQPEPPCYTLDTETEIKPRHLWYDQNNPKRVHSYVVIPGLLLKTPPPNKVMDFLSRMIQPSEPSEPRGDRDSGTTTKHTARLEWKAKPISPVGSSTSSASSAADASKISLDAAPPPSSSKVQFESAKPPTADFGEYGSEMVKPDKKSFCFLF